MTYFDETNTLSQKKPYVNYSSLMTLFQVLFNFRSTVYSTVDRE